LAGKTRHEQDLLWRAGGPILDLALRGAFRLRVDGQENLPTAGAAIIAANHVSLVDPVALAVVVWRRGRVIRFLTAAEFFHKPLIGWMLRRSGQIPIRRGAADRAALDRAARAITRGTLTGIFPEGQVRLRGVASPKGHRGVARLALVAGAPVIPVGVWGGQARWPASGPRLALPLRPPLGVVIGAALSPDGDVRDRQDVRDLTGRIMAGIADVERAARYLADRSSPAGDDPGGPGE
jgi:1-acyl-sn-glycerol-3-phosphate acyltransferase